MIRIGMCDDELLTIKSIGKIIESKIIEYDFDAEITTLTDDQDKIYELIKNNELDVLILDIDFGNNKRNGLELAHELRKINKDFYLVFLSAHPRYMHVSFINKTFDYLVKPIHPNAIADFVLRLKDEFQQNKKMFLHINKSLSVRTDDIFYIEKQGNKALIYTSSAIYTMINNSLDRLLDILPKNFRKCHRSYVINEDKILSIDKKNGNTCLGKDIYCPINIKYLL